MCISSHYYAEDGDAMGAYAKILAHGGCSLPARDDTDLAFLAERALVDGGNLGST